MPICVFLPIYAQWIFLSYNEKLKVERFYSCTSQPILRAGVGDLLNFAGALLDLLVILGFAELLMVGVRIFRAKYISAHPANLESESGSFTGLLMGWADYPC